MYLFTSLPPPKKKDVISRSFMNMLYIKGPRMLPCGDRNEIPFQFEN